MLRWFSGWFLVACPVLTPALPQPSDPDTTGTDGKTPNDTGSAAQKPPASTTETGSSDTGPGDTGGPDDTGGATDTGTQSLPMVTIPVNRSGDWDHVGSFDMSATCSDPPQTLNLDDSVTCCGQIACTDGADLTITCRVTVGSGHEVELKVNGYELESTDGVGGGEIIRTFPARAGDDFDCNYREDN